MIDPDNAEYKTIMRNFRLALVASVIMIGGGSVFYHIVEKLNWLNSVYFSVITLTTVGYGDIVPKTPAGKIFTVFYVLFGFGLIATLANLLVKRAVLRREARRHSK